VLDRHPPNVRHSLTYYTKCQAQPDLHLLTPCGAWSAVLSGNWFLDSMNMIDRIIARDPAHPVNPVNAKALYIEVIEK